MRKGLQPILLILFLAASAMASAQGYKPSGIAKESNSYVFSVLPFASPQDLFDTYTPVIKHLEASIPGVKFKIVIPRDFPEFETRLAAREFDFVLANAAEALVAFKNEYRAIAKMAPASEFYGVMVAKADSRIVNPRDLEGKPLCFPSATALTASIMNILYMHDHGVNIGKFQIQNVGSHNSSITSVHSGKFAACGTTARYLRIWSQNNPEKAKDLKVLWRTAVVPHNPVLVKSEVPSELAAKVAQVLVSMGTDQQLNQDQFKIGQNRFDSAKNSDYTPMVDILRRYDKIVGLPEALKQSIEK